MSAAQPCSTSVALLSSLRLGNNQVMGDVLSHMSGTRNLLSLSLDFDFFDKFLHEHKS